MKRPKFSGGIKQFVKESKRINQIINKPIHDIRTSDSPFHFLLRAARGDPLPQNRIEEVRQSDGTVIQHIVRELVVLPIETRIAIATKLLPYVAPRLAEVSVNVEPPTTPQEQQQVVIYQIPDNGRGSKNDS